MKLHFLISPRTALTSLAWLAMACGNTANDSQGAEGGRSGQAGSNGSAGAGSLAGMSSSTAGATGVAGAGTSGATSSAGTGTGESAGSGGASTPGSGAGSGGKSAASGGGGSTSGGSGGAGGGPISGCTGNAWPTADPTAAGPFEVTADKGVGPLAGVTPDPVYGDKQQRFNVYRPKDLAQGGYCHPILVWANGHTDNPEPNPPDCVSSKYCGSYLMLMNQLASHGFVVIASLSTITSQGTPLPTLVGLDWLLQQADDATSPYYHRLDTAHIGALGHSEGGFSTSKAASDPRITATATVSGSSINPGIHGPSLWFCGGKDTVVSCDSVEKTYSAITTQPAIFINNLQADHGGWLYQSGIKGPDIVGFTAWFRVQLMSDTANRKRFYGPSCTFCTDSRVQVKQNSFLAQ
ncbi:MAG: hypothetical protein ABUL62_14825 [Myxococcales bacterium]